MLGQTRRLTLNSVFFGGCNICWGFLLPADFLAHQWIQRSGGNRFVIKNQLARVCRHLAMCCARCVFTVSFRHRKFSHLQVHFHLFLYNRHFHLKPKSWKLKGTYPSNPMTTVSSTTTISSMLVHLNTSLHLFPPPCNSKEDLVSSYLKYPNLFSYSQKLWLSDKPEPANFNL